MQRHVHQFSAMGGPACIRLDAVSDALARDAITAAEQEVRRLENKYSRYRESSLTSEINRAAGGDHTVSIDAETAGLLQFADTLWRESAGGFDLSSGVLRRAWDFKSGQLPRQSLLDDILPLVDWASVQWTEETVYLPRPGMELDFGGCVKEYAVDVAVAVLRRVGISHAMVDLAGDMAVVGEQADGQPWRIGIRDPADPGRALAGVELRSGGLASSGNYERCIETPGRRYGHILDPRNGWPVEGLAAVSVTAEQCLVAGGSATLAMIRPEAEALAWLAELGLPWLAVDSRGAVHKAL
jgi:thiamine biosynthesis lipoprotein